MKDILNETCEQAITRANKDAETRILKSITYGLVINPNFSLEYSKFREVYLISKYQIDSYEAGCIIIGNEECYANQMQLLIDKKYGENFFEEVEPEIRELYERLDSLSPNELENIIDLNYTYGYGRIDERADYLDGWEQLYKELHNRIDFSNFSFEPYKYDRIGIRLIIDRTGKIEECEVVSIGFPEEIGTLIERTVAEIGNWKPAVLYGFNVKSDNMLSFPLSMN
jgi:hypothetical protein